MAIIRLLRAGIFALIILFSLVVLGICAHTEYLLAGFTDTYTSYVPLGIAVAGLTIISLPLFWVLSMLQQRVFTSMIIFEIIWFFLLWVIWVATAGDAVAGKSFYFPDGCIYNDFPTTNLVCNEATVVEAFSFLNFFCAFIYYDVVLLYAIINAIRGRNIWTASVREATTSAPGAPMAQAQFNAVPTGQYQGYGAYPPNVPPTQPYNAFPQQVPPPGTPPTQPYGVPPQQYGTYPQQVPPGSPANLSPGQNHNYAPPPPAPQQQVNYAAYAPSPTGNTAALPPQPNYNSYPTGGAQAPLPQPSGYLEQSVPQQQQLPSHYGSH